jgi:hypothetical protein
MSSRRPARHREAVRPVHEPQGAERIVDLPNKTPYMRHYSARPGRRPAHPLDRRRVERVYESMLGLCKDRAVTSRATHTEHGDRTVALDGEILRTVVGSGVHGIAIEGTDDHDEMGIFIEPPTRVIGLHRPAEHYVFRTQPEGARSGPGDTDLVMYSLRKYLRLATKGNPTALLPLYAPQPAVLAIRPLGQELRDLASSVLSQRAVRRFLGYMNAQRERLLGRGRRSSVPGRQGVCEPVPAGALTLQASDPRVGPQ